MSLFLFIRPLRIGVACSIQTLFWVIMWFSLVHSPSYLICPLHYQRKVTFCACCNFQSGNFSREALFCPRATSMGCFFYPQTSASPSGILLARTISLCASGRKLCAGRSTGLCSSSYSQTTSSIAPPKMPATELGAHQSDAWDVT